jgi:glutamine synthetase
MDKIQVSEEAIDSVLDSVKKHDIKYIRLVIVDIDGNPRALVIPEYELKQTLNYGIGFDGSSIPGFAVVNKSDLHANPDPSTFIIPMWETPGVAIMFCYLSTPDGAPFDGDPRGLLKAAVDELEEDGYGFNTGPELEYFYVTEDRGQISPYGGGGYFDLPPLDPTEDIKMETMMCLEAAGFQLDKIHHEVAMGQQEINFRYGDALKTADNVILYKLAVKTIAQKHGCIATFMPKPFWGVNGSGCHVHQSLIELDSGRNIFHSPNTETGLSEEAEFYIGGVLENARAMSMVVAPLVNSYKRLVPHYEAPVYISWGLGNSSTLVRDPLYPGEKDKVTRIEYRHPDGASNPYLVATAMLKAGMDGIKNKTKPVEPVSENVFDLSREEIKNRGIEILPEHLGEAIKIFSENKVITSALGNYISKNLIKMKTLEFNEYQNFTGNEWAASRPTITSWEIEKYLYRY